MILEDLQHGEAATKLNIVRNERLILYSIKISVLHKVRMLQVDNAKNEKHVSR